jgi:hypothetical protein
MPFLIKKPASAGFLFRFFLPYECTYSYQVFSNPADCVSEGAALDCDLKYVGQCEVDGVPNALPDQVWYGNIGHRGNGFTGNGNTTEVILIQRQDGVEESVGGGPATCGKIGTLVKISDFPQDLVQE